MRRTKASLIYRRTKNLREVGAPVGSYQAREHRAVRSAWGTWIRTKIDGVGVPIEPLILFNYFANRIKNRPICFNGLLAFCKLSVQRLITPRRIHCRRDRSL